VCPWNKFAKAGNEAKLAARADLASPHLAELLTLDDKAFRSKFAASSVKRAGRDRFLRNVLIASGNSADASLKPLIIALLVDQSSLVRAMAVWALTKLADADEFSSIRDRYYADEPDEAVKLEWDRLNT
jgi:epoxyqueuosine reductase